MPIDYSDYIDMSLFAQAPPDIYLAALEYARLTIPELTIRQGTPEDAVLQAASYITSQNLSAINELPNRLMSGVLSLLGAPRDEGDFPVIEVAFTSATHEGAVIEAGTLLRYDYNFVEPPISVYFETVEELVISSVENTGATPLPTGVVEARGTETLDIFPIASNSALQIESVNADVYSATVESITNLGRLPESDSEYLNRASTYLGSLSSSFGKASQVEAYILTRFLDVLRVKVYDLTDPGGSLEVGEPDVGGKITVFTYGNGANLSSERKYEILLDISNRSIAGLQIGVLDAVLANVTVTVNATYSSFFTPSIIEENIERSLLSFLNPDSYPFVELIRKSSLYPSITSVPGVEFVSSISMDWYGMSAEYIVNGDGDLVVPFKGVLPRLTPENITVNLTLGT